ncbi:MAG: PH domain-containing protein [Nanoarchaeota archaeon]|nr:PH domain-containing protein [Nanoarchaeota archaeon]MBU1643780.1 PH domain-containing protein [Nanoarchaeota archaeon]MBU1977008.1 PH domain-containing protein [Nanoarchaeota archaeon]
MGKSEAILTLNSARRCFLPEYCCGLLLLFLLFAAYQKGISLPRPAIYFVGGLGLLSIGIAEYTRFFGDRYKVFEDKLLMINGMINVNKKMLYYHPLAFVPDMNIKQTAWERLLGYGTIFITVSGERFEIKNVTNPNFVLEMFEQLIDKSRKHEEKIKKE